VTGLIYISLHWKTEYNFFVVLPFYRWELVRDFGGERWDQIPEDFSKLSAINEFGVPLPTTV